MKRRVLASVPGKLILMGEHAAVYGRPALVSAVGPRAFVSVGPSRGKTVIDLPNLERRSETCWRELFALAETASSRWAEYSREPTPDRFRELGTDTPEHLVAIALGEVSRELGSVDLPEVEVRVESKLPIGSGFGSSAATAVAVIGAMLAFLELEVEEERIDRLAFEVERRQHGFPSGVDHKTVIHGGVLWARRSDQGSLEVEPLGLRPERLADLLVYQTGRPRESTGEVVAAVKRLASDEPVEFERRLDVMERCVDTLREYLCGSDAQSDVLRSVMQSYEKCLEELGVVPKPIESVVRAIELTGGAAKISGAGALSGSSAGCLLVQPADGPTAMLPDELRAYERQTVELGDEGFRIEEIE
ncbi:MAG: mevalonate kinase [Acidobacteriota bacterium]